MSDASKLEFIWNWCETAKITKSSRVRNNSWPRLSQRIETKLKRSSLLKELSMVSNMLRVTVYLLSLQLTDRICSQSAWTGSPNLLKHDESISHHDIFLDIRCWSNGPLLSCRVQGTDEGSQWSNGLTEVC